MKKYLLALSALLAVNTPAQTTNTPPPAITNAATATMPAFPSGGAFSQITSALANLPTTTLDQETLGVDVSAVAHGGSSIQNAIKLDYVIHTNYFLAAEIQTDSGADTIGSAGLLVGLRKAWTQAAVFGNIGGRYNWDTRNMEGIAGIGAIWQPSASSRLSCSLEQRGVLSRNGKQPSTETLLGVHIAF